MEFDQAQFATESLRMAGQFVGALAIAWLAVRWALARYKAEKMWERRLGAFADIVSALSTMRKLNRAWLEDVENHRDFNELKTKERIRRLTSERERIDEVFAVGSLLLPLSTIQIIEQFIYEWNRPEHLGDGHAQMERDLAAIERALSELLQQGRDVLGITELDRGG